MLIFFKFINSKRLELAVVLIVIIGSIGLYLKLGSVDFDGATKTVHSFALEEEGHSSQVADIAALLGPLKDKLTQNPNDPNGWALLARSYVEIGQHASSFSSFEEAIKLLPNDPQLLADYADAIVVVNGHQFSNKAESLIERALTIDPNLEKALLLSATNAFKKANYQQAINQWEKLLKVTPFDSPKSKEILASIDEANQLAGNSTGATPIKSIKKSISNIVDISGVVKLAPSFEEKVSDTDSVFIFAKAINGTPMPISAIMVFAKDLPYVYHLNDTNSLNPDVKLSSVDKVVIVARLSKDGDATAKPGDMQGVSKVIEVGEVLQDVEINQMVD